MTIYRQKPIMANDWIITDKSSSAVWQAPVAELPNLILSIRCRVFCFSDFFG
jgi:hypothetical protein